MVTNAVLAPSLFLKKGRVTADAITINLYFGYHS